jgi:hypothetical protein
MCRSYDTCRTCQGAGVVPGVHQFDPQDYHDDPCPACLGDGRHYFRPADPILRLKADRLAIVRFRDSSFFAPMVRRQYAALKARVYGLKETTHVQAT